MPECTHRVTASGRQPDGTTFVALSCGHQYSWGDVRLPRPGALILCRVCARERATPPRPMHAGFPTYRPGGDIRVRTRDHPEANGRTPHDGERSWTFFFPLDDGRTLYLDLGTEGRRALETVLLEDLVVNACGAPDAQED